MIKIGFIGAGNMGASLARATARHPDAELYIYDKNEERSSALASELGARVSTADEISRTCGFIFLAVKPNIIHDVALEIRDAVSKRDDAVIVSMAAGISLATLEDDFKNKDIRIIRIMPNTPSAVNCGMTLWCNNEAVENDDVERFLAIMEGSGRCDKIPEALIDAGSAVSGCGPAFVYMFIEALADGGVLCGLPREKALIYAAETVKGAAQMVLSGAGHPEALKDAVCSPGGSTIVGVHALEEGGLRAACENAVIGAFEKTKDLGKKKA